MFLPYPIFCHNFEGVLVFFSNFLLFKSSSGELTESEDEDQNELPKEAAEETVPPEAEMLENKENNERRKSSSSPSKSSRHSEKSSSKDSQKDKDSKSSRLKKELDAEDDVD